MADVRNASGLPVCPADEVMRQLADREAESCEQEFAERMGFAPDPDPAPTLTRTIISACVVGLLAIAMLAIGGCGGKVEVDVLDEPPIIRYIKEFCAVDAEQRFADLLSVNEAMDEYAVAVIACADVDIVALSFQTGEYLGWPAGRITGDLYYMFRDPPGERASAE